METAKRCAAHTLPFQFIIYSVKRRRILDIDYLVLDCHVGLRPPPKKIDGFHIVRIEIATVAYGSFAMTLLAHFLLHTS